MATSVTVLGRPDLALYRAATSDGVCAHLTGAKFLQEGRVKYHNLVTERLYIHAFMYIDLLTCSFSLCQALRALTHSKILTAFFFLLLFFPFPLSLFFFPSLFPFLPSLFPFLPSLPPPLPFFFPPSLSPPLTSRSAQSHLTLSLMFLYRRLPGRLGGTGLAFDATNLHGFTLAKENGALGYSSRGHLASRSSILISNASRNGAGPSLDTNV